MPTPRRPPSPPATGEASRQVALPAHGQQRIERVVDRDDAFKSAAVVDDRHLLGVPIWTKPFKFAVSLVIYTGTLAYLIGLIIERQPEVCRHHFTRQVIIGRAKTTGQDQHAVPRQGMRDVRLQLGAVLGQTIETLSKGFKPLAVDACRRVLDGSTSVDEISRVVDLTDRLRD